MNLVERNNRIFGLGLPPHPSLVEPGNQAVAQRAAQMGLGQPPTAQDLLAGVLGVGFSQVPVIEYVTLTTELPLLDQDISASFGAKISILNAPNTGTPGTLSTDSSFVQNGTLQVDMLCLGFGVHIFAEPQSGSTIGNAVVPNEQPGTYPVSPDAFTVNDATNGALAPTDGELLDIQPADLEWGACAWNAAWHLVNAYQLQWIVQQRYLLINELAADVSYFGPYAEAIAAGTSQEGVQRFARRINDRYRQLGGGAPPGGFVFEPINAQRISSVGPGGLLNPGANVGVFHPTRAYDTMNVTWGGVRNQGASGAPQPFRKLFKPVLLEKGIPIGLQLVVQDTYHQQKMQQYLSITESPTGGGSANMQFDVNSNGLTSPATAPVFLELTLDATPIVVSQQVNTNRVLFKGGAFKMAMLIKGYELWGDWKQALKNSLGVGGAIYMPGAGQAGIGSNIQVR